MDTSKIIRGAVSNGRYTVTAPIVKEDYGLYLQIEGLELPSTYEVDFSNSENSGTSVTMIGNADGVLIPRQFIDSGKDVFAFLYHVGDNYGRTVFKFRIPNKLRPDRTDEEPTPEQASTIDQTISALNTAVAKTAQDVIDADEAASDALQAVTSAALARDAAREYARRADTAASNAETSAESASVFANASAQSAQSAERSAQTASAKADAITGLTATATTLPDGSSATASYNPETGVMSFGIPKGKDGTNGIDGDDGYSPTANVSKTGKTTTITITDKNGTTSAQVEDGDDYILTEQDKEEIADMIEVPSDWLKAFPTDTASGSIASFPDGADNLPLKSLVVSVDPKQDGTGDPSPDNVRPISGWTGMEIQHNSGDYTLFGVTTGKTLNASGEVISESGMGVSEWMPVNTDDVVTLKYTSTSAARSRRVIGYDANKAFVSVLSSISWANVGQEYTQTVTVQDGIKYIRACFLLNDTHKSFLNESNITTIPISWQTEAGTVYGGSLDVLTGILTVDRAMVDLGTLTWREYGSTDDVTQYFTTGIDSLVKGYSEGLCSALKRNTTKSEWTWYIAAAAGSGRLYVRTPKLYYPSSADFKTAMNGVQLVYELKEPQTYQLTPHEVNSLLGVNNIFADTGDTSCEYRADTKLYIERLTAPDSADMIADANITSGQYFMVGNSLYKATANIANGGQITVGTNCIRKSLSEALNEINA